MSLLTRGLGFGPLVTRGLVGAASPPGGPGAVIDPALWFFFLAGGGIPPAGMVGTAGDAGLAQGYSLAADVGLHQGYSTAGDE
jgi:hypothetical protein